MDGLRRLRRVSAATPAVRARGHGPGPAVQRRPAGPALLEELRAGDFVAAVRVPMTPRSCPRRKLCRKPGTWYLLSGGQYGQALMYVDPGNPASSNQPMTSLAVCSW